MTAGTLAGSAVAVAAGVWVGFAVAPAESFSTIQVGQCVRQDGAQARRVDCTDAEAYTVTARVYPAGACPDPGQPYAMQERTQLCLAPADRQPAGRQPINPQQIGPKQVNPHQDGQQRNGQQQIGPQQIGPQPARPQPARPQPTASTSAAARPAGARPVNPKASSRKPTNPTSAAPTRRFGP